MAACPTCNKTRCTCDSDYDADDEFSDFNDSSEPEDEEDCDGYYSTTNLRVRHSGPWQQYNPDAETDELSVTTASQSHNLATAETSQSNAQSSTHINPEQATNPASVDQPAVASL